MPESLAEVISAWPDDMALFCTEMFGPLRDWQEQAADILSGHAKLSVKKARGVGGTMFSCFAALWWTVSRPDGLVVLVVPTWREGLIWWESFRRVWQASKLPALFPGAQTLKDEFRDGENRARIVTVWLSARNLPRAILTASKR